MLHRRLLVISRWQTKLDIFQAFIMERTWTAWTSTFSTTFVKRKACIGVKIMDMRLLRHGEGSGRPVNHRMARIVVCLYWLAMLKNAQWWLRHARLMQLAPKNVRWPDAMRSHHLTIIHCHNLTGVSLSVEIHPRLACRVAQRNLTLMHTWDCLVKERIGSGKRSTCCTHRTLTNQIMFWFFAQKSIKRCFDVWNAKERTNRILIAFEPTTMHSIKFSMLALLVESC